MKRLVLMAEVHIFMDLSATRRSGRLILNNIFLNIIKYNVHTYCFCCCYLLDVYTAFILAPSTRISSLCDTSWSSRECTVTCLISWILRGMFKMHWSSKCHIKFELYGAIKADPIFFMLFWTQLRTLSKLISCAKCIVTLQVNKM
jgi:hypothetical protein